MKIVEFCGLPGSGKSTLKDEYKKVLKEDGYTVVEFNQKFYMGNIIAKIKRKLFYFLLSILPINFRLNNELKKFIRGQKNVNKDWIFQILLLNYRIDKTANADYIFLDEGIVQCLAALYYDSLIEKGEGIKKIVDTLSSKYKENINVFFCDQDYDITIERLNNRNREGDRYVLQDIKKIRNLFDIKILNLQLLIEHFEFANIYKIDLRNNIEANIDYISSKLNG